MTEKNGVRTFTLTAAGAVLLLLILLFAHALPSDRLLSLKDAGHLFLALKARTGQAFRNAELPLWDETIGCGVPFLADPVSQVLYPGNLLFYFASPVQGLKYFTLLHIAFAVGALMFLAREFQVSREGALVGGLLFAGSGAVISLHYNPVWMAGLPWLLVSMACSRRILHHAGRWGTAVLLSCSLWMLVLAGAFELVLAYLIYVLAELIAVFLYDWFASTDGRHARARLRPGLLVGLAGGVAIGLSAGQLLPTFELLWFSFRSIGVLNFEANVWSLAPGRLIELIAPFIFGDPSSGPLWTALLNPSIFGNQPLFSGLYLGVPAVALAMAGAGFIVGRDRFILVGMALMTLLLAWGDHTPVLELFRAIVPGMSLFRYPAKIFILSMIALSVLGAAGADAFIRGKSDARRLLFVFAIGSIAVLIGVLIAGWIYQRALAEWVGAVVSGEGLPLEASGILQSAAAGLARGLAVALLFVIILGCSRRLPSVQWRWLILIGVILLDLGLVNRHLILTASRETHLSVPETLPSPDHLQAETGMFRLGQPPSESLGLFYEPHRLAFLGYRTADSYGSLGMGNLVLFDVALKGRPVRALQMKSVRFSVHRSSRERGAFRVEKVSDPLPRVLLISRAALAPEDAAVRETLGRESFDPRNEVIFSGAPVEVLEWGVGTRKALDASSKTRIVVDSSRRVSIEVQTPIPAYLLLSDTWYPGWRATIDGNPISIYRANLMFRAVQVPTGRSRIEFLYRPDSVRAGLEVTGLSLLLLGWMGSLWYREP